MAIYKHKKRINGDTILAEEWNHMGLKIESINAKLDEEKSVFDGSLQVADALNVTNSINLGEDVIFGSSGKRFMIHSRGDDKDFLQILADKIDGNWDRANGITLRKSGDVGIATNTPAARLDVNGNAQVSGSLTVKGKAKLMGGIDGGLTVDGNLKINGNANFKTGLSVNDGNVTPDNNYGIYWHTNSDRSYAIYREPGAWTNPYPDLRIAFYTGIKLGAHRNYGGTRFYNNSDMKTELMSVGNGNNNVKVNYDLNVKGRLVGAAKDQNGTALRVCCGKTPAGRTKWVAYQGGNTGIYVDVDTSGCGFTSVPHYVVSLHGTSSHWATTGGSEPYSATKNKFRIYVRFSSGSTLTPSTANSWKWHIEWIAIGK